MAAANENVLVVRREIFDELGSFQGLKFQPQRYLDALLARGNNHFLSRAVAENDPTHKQIIPYALLACADRVLPYARGQKAGAQRPVAKGSRGICGTMTTQQPAPFAAEQPPHPTRRREPCLADRSGHRP